MCLNPHRERRRAWPGFTLEVRHAQPLELGSNHNQALAHARRSGLSCACSTPTLLCA